MKRIIATIAIAILIFLCGCAVGNHHAIIHAIPWVDEQTNAILIDFDGDVHIYE